MKSNFIVSDYRKIWMKDYKKKFIIEPYVCQKLDLENLVNNPFKIETIPYLRKNRKDFKNYAEVVDKKYQNYSKLLSKGFNIIHNVNFEEKFWKKILGIFLIRYITLLYEMYKICDKHLNIDRHLFNNISKESFFVPDTNEDFLHYFKHTQLGQEQLFSIFIHTFYPGIEKKQIDKSFEPKAKTKNNSTIGIREKFSLTYFLSNRSKITLNRMLRLILQKSRKPKVAIMGSHFRSQFLDELVVKSFGKINQINWEEFIPDINRNNFNSEKRNNLIEYCLRNNKHNDDFDRYFFSSINYCLPKIYIENFHITHDHIVRQLRKYPKLNFIISEAWISNSIMSFALACMKNNGIQHINNEHNFISHIFLKTDIPLIAELSDYFITLGWSDKKIPKAIKGASLFDWGYDNKNIKKKHKILFINYPAFVKAHQYKPVYQTTAENSILFFDFINKFFKNLKKDIVSEITFRDYPQSQKNKWMLYDDRNLLNKFVFKDYAKSNINAKKDIGQSRLVIISALSTSWLESLIMDVPTIIFWNVKTLFIKREYESFFNELIDVGICQTNPKKAAEFVEKISEDPEKWWKINDVQKAKSNFLQNNIGDPKDMINYLLTLAR